MAYVPGFSNDIFISYSHLDDAALDGPGWVTDFHMRLQVEVQQEIGAKVQIWRDKRISAAMDFTKELDKQVRGSAMLLAIISPGYVNSRWCDWELSGFATSRRVGDLWVDTKCRAIKLFKRPADVYGLHVLADTEGIKFYDVDSHSESSYEIHRSSDLYKRRMADLGREVGFVLRAMRKSRSVFLGTASAALRNQRERVCQELQGREYRVLTVPDDPPDHRPMRLRSAMRDSALSILFYDRTASPGDQQAEAPAAVERQVALEEGARQIVVVRGQPDATSGPWDEPSASGLGSSKVEWLIDPQPNALYHTVLQMLRAPEEPDVPAAEGVAATEPTTASEQTAVRPEAARSQKLVRVYMICDRPDHPLLESNRARNLRDHLLRLGFEVKLPLADHAAAAEFTKDNRNKLKQCDAVLLYWGTARQAWFDQRLGELMQARGWRHGRAFAVIGAYVGDPENAVKQNYETREVDELIKQFDSLDLDDTRLVRFVERLGEVP